MMELVGTLLNSEGNPIVFNVTGTKDKDKFFVPMDYEEILQFEKPNATFVVYEPEDQDDLCLRMYAVTCSPYRTLGCWEIVS